MSKWTKCQIWGQKVLIANTPKCLIIFDPVNYLWEALDNRMDNQADNWVHKWADDRADNPGDNWG